MGGEGRPVKDAGPTSAIRSDFRLDARVGFCHLARTSRAGVVKLVDAPDSKSGSARSVGSIPTTRTTGFLDRSDCPVADCLPACYARLMKLRHILPPVLFGLLFLTIISVGDALFWSVPHALEKLPPRLLTVVVLTALWLVHVYKRMVR